MDFIAVVIITSAVVIASISALLPQILTSVIIIVITISVRRQARYNGHAGSHIENAQLPQCMASVLAPTISSNGGVQRHTGEA